MTVMISLRAGGRGAAQRLTSLLANGSLARQQPSRTLHVSPFAAASPSPGWFHSRGFASIPTLPLAFPQRSFHAASLRAASTVASTLSTPAARVAQTPVAASLPKFATVPPLSHRGIQHTPAPQRAASGTQSGRTVATATRRGGSCTAGQPAQASVQAPMSRGAIGTAGQPRRLSGGRFPPAGPKQWLGLAVSAVVAVGALVLLFSIGMAFLTVLIPILVGGLALAALYGAFRSSRFGGASHNPTGVPRS